MRVVANRSANLGCCEVSRPKHKRLLILHQRCVGPGGPLCRLMVRWLRVLLAHGLQGTALGFLEKPHDVPYAPLEHIPAQTRDCRHV